MLTGYNTDVSYGGVLFHVQTEDKGIHSPIILSLVYRAGTILAAKRTPYANLIQDGVVDELAVAQMLNRQHQILVAAIKSGKSDKLAELSRQYSDQKGKPLVEPPATASPASPAKPAVVAGQAAAAAEPRRRAVALSKPEAPVAPRVESKLIEAIGFDQIIAGYLETACSPEQLRIELLYPSKFRSGDAVTVRLATFLGGHHPASGTTVRLQVLGTKIPAQTWDGRTDAQGLVSFNIKIPVFTSGAAALVIKANTPGGQETEAKFMIGQK